jgi:hypothetical protein
MPTPTELLAETETAIQNCLKAQSYTIAGRQKQMAMLKELREFRAELKREIDAAAESGGSMCSLGMQTRPSA